jgi:hypothetical protein
MDIRGVKMVKEASSEVKLYSDQINYNGTLSFRPISFRPVTLCHIHFVPTHHHTPTLLTLTPHRTLK